ncbi:MAG: cell division ATP-binding protein FtsE [Candidatus Sungbacteria bacterium RIFCSPLOWO2_02_FULL_51_17]|uniref:Cell division ATP-binding protein FtsE n=1 Tax=Candidatus Sungbacteria bacterium RIFCSPHIGHO2_02_FULL_51_29 TaxID=1802273 RepID=A0A1G2KPH0_9BACT|nr:MAG: cell division ATP-binding protein FtsE [Candidatus Sungbacteria bacterium RIFCSPHIGHO2_01_FULL_51_22]OHA01300.1 MAG: cell division ATP-binding protein FtsE [Candidatus Sungbacteria bacterium RIFCSPHIGHO2_02_FULL_51_29]OHA06471.1 MAG: cell division ATP-binding protein FtsE [Candidatus Sungbacteria bacterium RIFCSPLOWO2_01_FULL_51_34]OHA12533.1 MAG: cell division ATP-binding protein FtsE [Candidatus Sungbacteria bacterium RIFCSPLOWO2_02_FULL_51_17]
MIFFDKVSKIYSPTSAALKNVTVRILPKEFVSVVGSSGAGKSTLLKLLIAEERPTEGRIFLDGDEVSALSYRELPRVRRRIGSIFQDFKLLRDKTAYENIAFAMEAAGRDPKEIEEDVPQVLDLVGLSDKAYHFPHELSGGEKQRVAIARAFVNQPDVITADEPTGNLDPVNTWEIIELLTKINELGTTVILATHNKEIVDWLSRRVITIDKGELIRDEQKGTYIL